MDKACGVPADFLATTFARLGQIAPEPSDVYFGLVFRVAGRRPALGAVRARVAERIAALPRLTERLVLGAAVSWEPDPDFDLAHHVRELPAGTGVVPARTVLADSLDPARPPWGLWVADDGDGWLLYYLVHHARQDAVAAVRTVTALLGDAPAPADPPLVRRPDGPRRWAALAPLYPDLARRGPTTPRRRFGLGRAVAWHSADLALLTEVADHTGAAVNHVHLAAMSSALDQWVPVTDTATRQVAIPVDTRDGDDDFVNRIGLMRVALPSGALPPERRLRAVMTAAGRRRTARYRRAWAELARDPDPRAAAWAMGRITDPDVVSVTLSSLRVPDALTLAGAPVLAVTAIPWLPPGHTCFGLLVSHGDQVRLSVVAPEGAPEPTALVTAWRDALRELHAAHADRAQLAAGR